MMKMMMMMRRRRRRITTTTSQSVLAIGTERRALGRYGVGNPDEMTRSKPVKLSLSEGRDDRSIAMMALDSQAIEQSHCCRHDNCKAWDT